MILNKTRCLTAALLLSATVYVKAQSLSPEVISSAGDVFTSSSGSISYTIGEPVSETFSVTPNILTQGFQQPFVVSLTGIPEQTSADNIYAYPNPVKDELLIDFGTLKSGTYILRIIDMAGKEIENKKVEVGGTSFIQGTSLAKYDNGIYFIEIMDSGKTFMKTFKIVKQN